VTAPARKAGSGASKCGSGVPVARSAGCGGFQARGRWHGVGSTSGDGRVAAAPTRRRSGGGSSVTAQRVVAACGGGAMTQRVEVAWQRKRLRGVCGRRHGKASRGGGLSASRHRGWAGHALSAAVVVRWVWSLQGAAWRWPRDSSVRVARRCPRGGGDRWSGR
jgi:hypothetical protein